LSTIDNFKGPRFNLSGCSSGFLMLWVVEANIGLRYIGGIADIDCPFADIASLHVANNIRTHPSLQEESIW
jgi:hypothetical protein